MNSVKEKSISLISGQMSSSGANMAKVIATVGTVFCHSAYTYTFEGIAVPEFVDGFKAIASPSVPVFFLISGYYLMLRDNFSWKENMKKKLKTLVVPYVCWLLLYTLVNMACYHILPGLFDNYTEFTLEDWFHHLIGTPFEGYPIYYGPFWFLRDLIILNFLTFLLVPLVKFLPAVITIPAMIALQLSPLPYPLRYSFAFFIMGMVFGRRKAAPVFSIWTTAVAFAVCFVVSILIDSDLFGRVSVLLMTFVIISASEHMVKNPKMRTAAAMLMPFSFITYAAHSHPIVLAQRLAAMKLDVGADLATVLYFVLPFVVIGLCCVFAIICKRWIPKIYGVFVGSR